MESLNLDSSNVSNVELRPSELGIRRRRIVKDVIQPGLFEDLIQMTDYQHLVDRGFLQETYARGNNNKANTTMAVSIGKHDGSMPEKEILTKQFLTKRRNANDVEITIPEKMESINLDSNVPNVEHRPKELGIRRRGTVKDLRSTIFLLAKEDSYASRDVFFPVHPNMMGKVVPVHLTMARDQQFLGRGAFGKVYKRHHDSSNTTVAVKIVKHCGSISENEISRSIKSEIEILGKLDHHRIIKFHGCLEKANGIEIFLEYMPNGSVKDYMSKHCTPFTELMTAELTRNVLEGLVYLHANRILHRDVKGSNVLLDDGLNAKLGDFGISKKIQTLTNSNTCCNTHVGTPYWMSPERIRGEKYGKTADIWSIGCTVVEMLTMHPPWHEFETNAAIFKIGSGIYPTYQLPPTASTKLQDFLRRTFRQKASKRPTATELLKHPFLYRN